MAANGNSGNGNTSTGQSAASAQAAAAAGNAAASNAANGNTGTGNTSGNTSGTSGNGKGNAGSTAGSTNTSTNTSTSNNATNSAGLMGSLIGFGNAVAKGEVGNNGGGGSGTANKTYSEVAKEMGYSEEDIAKNDRMQSFIANIFTNAEKARNSLSAEQVAAGDRAYTKARAEGKTEAEAQFAARDTMRGMITEGALIPGFKSSYTIGAFKAKNTGPTYNPATTAMSNVNPTIAAGSSKMGPSAPAANNAPGGNLGGETGGIVGGAAPSVSDAANTGVTYRGGTVTNGGTSVTDSGTGGSVSSGVNAPSRDASSIGLGVYNNDRANYDQDNWNRGMEAESSSLVSDEECKAFAKRAFMENSEPFKKIRVTICKKC